MAAQLAFPVDGGPGPACAEHEFSSVGLKLLHGLDHKPTGPALEGDEGVVVISYRIYIMVFSYILYISLSISQNRRLYSNKTPARFSEEKVQVFCKYSGDKCYHDLDAHAQGAGTAGPGQAGDEEVLLPGGIHPPQHGETTPVPVQRPATRLESGGTPST